LNTTEIFDATSYQWDEIKQRGNIPSGRWGHSSVVIGNLLYVIGGTSRKNLEPCSDTIFRMVIDLGEWSMLETRAGLPPSTLIFHTSEVLDSRILTASPTSELKTQLSIFETETLHWIHV
jgi:hypothetical protein